MTARTDLSIETDDGTCPAVLVTPDGDGPWPAVIVYMDAGGVRPAMLHIAERLAAMGYAALLPELYHRHGDYPPFDFATVFSDSEERTRLMGMVMSLTQDRVSADTTAFLAALDARPEVAPGGVGATGYCMGGGFALTAAADHPDRIVAVASFHGGHLATDAPDSPHRKVDRITGRVVIAAASDDHTFPAEQAERLAGALAAGGVDHTMDTYPAAHGFAVTDAPTHDDEAEARHWAALGDLFATLA